MKASRHTIRNDLFSISLFMAQICFESLHADDFVCLTRPGAAEPRRALQGNGTLHTSAWQPSGTQHVCESAPADPERLREHPCPVTADRGLPRRGHTPGPSRLSRTRDVTRAMDSQELGAWLRQQREA